MKSSVLIMIAFAGGVLAGVFSLLPIQFTQTDMALYALYLLVFLVGLGVGGNHEAWQVIRQVKLKIVLVPLSVVLGTLLGAGLFSLLVPAMTLPEALAVGAGFGYYSLSSIIISQIKGEALGVIALLANLSREMLTLLLAPLMVKYLGKLAPIASGGATSMDTTLPVITRFSGKEYAMIAFFSGAVLSMVVPLLVPFVLQLDFIPI